MRLIVIVLILLYVVLAFLGCLDREDAVRRAAWKEGRREASREVDRVLNRVVAGGVGGHDWPARRARARVAGPGARRHACR